jgi:hypothetical protein
VTTILKSKGVETRIVTAARGEPKEGAAASDGGADPNNRKVWVVALDVATAKPASEQQAAAEQPPKTKTAKPEVRRNEHFGRPCRLCRDSDDHGDSRDHDRDHHGMDGMH